jgi:RNase P subunit RPR2
MVDELSYGNDRNTRRVSCAWCDIVLVSYAGRKVLMSEDDALDYDWACVKCHDKIRYGEL